MGKYIEVIPTSKKFLNDENRCIECPLTDAERNYLNETGSCFPSTGKKRFLVNVFKNNKAADYDSAYIINANSIEQAERFAEISMWHSLQYPNGWSIAAIKKTVTTIEEVGKDFKF